jgi:hypothetical protein
MVDVIKHPIPQHPPPEIPADRDVREGYRHYDEHGLFAWLYWKLAKAFYDWAKTHLLYPPVIKPYPAIAWTSDDHIHPVSWAMMHGHSVSMYWNTRESSKPQVNCLDVSFIVTDRKLLRPVTAFAETLEQRIPKWLKEIPPRGGGYGTPAFDFEPGRVEVHVFE